MPQKVPNKVPNKTELTILRLLTENPRLTRTDLARLTGISESGLKKSIANMKAAAWITRIGSNRTGYWLVTPPADI